MSRILYTPEELVRLELLCYDNPEGLHPIEANWRNLARKLMQHVQEADQETKEALDKVAYKSEKQKNFNPFQFPIKFTASQPINNSEE